MINSLFDLLENLNSSYNTPKVNKVYKDNKIYYQIEVPGFEKNEINLTMHKGYLTIEAKHNDPIFGERKFNEIISISQQLKHVESNLKNGVLQIVFEETKENGIQIPLM